MASGATVGSAVIRLSFDGKSVNAELDKVEQDVEKKTSGMGQKIGSGMKKVAVGVAAAFTGAATAVVGLTKSAVSSFADYEQLVGGVETLFKDSSSQLIEYANNAYKTAQLSANEYMDIATSFSASLLQSLGGNTKEAVEYTNRAITDMSDNANKMGTDISLIQNAYQGFAKQNYTMLDNLKLGYGGTKEEMARLIQDAAKLTDVQNELGVTVDANSMSFGNIVNAISVMQSSMGIAGTTTKEASNTISGSLGMMRSAWSNLLTGVADDSQDLDTLIGNLVSSVATFGKNILPVIGVALNGVGDLIGTLGPIIIEKLPAVINEVLPALLGAAGNILQALIQNLPSILTTLVQSIIQYLPTLMQMLVGAVPTLITGITQMIIQIANMLTQPQFLQMILQAGIQLLLELVHAIPQMLVSLVEALPTIIDNIITFLTDPATIQMIIEGAIELFMGLVQAVPQILGALVGAFGELVGNLWNNIVSFFSDFAGQFGDKISGIFKGAINGVLQFIENFINGPINLINGFIDTVNGALGALGVNIGHIPNVSLPRLARGGVVDGATAAVIGEAGQEAVLPLENNTGNWAGLLASTLAIEMEEQGTSGRPITVYMTNEINSELDAQEIGRVMTESIRRAA